MCLISLCALSAALMGGVPVVAELKPHMGRATIFINGQPEAPLQYSLVGKLGAQPWLPEAQELLHDFAEQGYRLFGCEIWLSEIWHEDHLDVDHVKRQLQAIRAVRADAAVHLRIYMDAPKWWREKHPEALIGYALQPSGNIPASVHPGAGFWDRASFASAQWRKDAGE